MIVPALNEETHNLLMALYSEDGDQPFYNWRDLEKETSRTKEELQPMVEVFKKLGIVVAAKGLRTDDGDFYGSGFGIPSEAEHVVELAIRRYEARSFETPAPEITLDGHKYKLVA